MQVIREITLSRRRTQVDFDAGEQVLGVAVLDGKITLFTAYAPPQPLIGEPKPCDACRTIRSFLLLGQGQQGLPDKFEYVSTVNAYGIFHVFEDLT